MKDNKAPPMIAILDTISQEAFGNKRSDALKGDTCVFCKGPAVDFNDELSKKEYAISGICQSCQGDFFESVENSTWSPNQ